MFNGSGLRYFVLTTILRKQVKEYSNHFDNMIPNKEFKEAYISDLYIRKSEYNIMLWLTDLSRNENFFSWLFDDDSLKGCTETQLSEEQYEDWWNFYKSFDPYI